eukprot:Nk52_evm11s373 gene=Nk52_evmTU11s373
MPSSTILPPTQKAIPKCMFYDEDEEEDRSKDDNAGRRHEIPAAHDLITCQVKRSYAQGEKRLNAQYKLVRIQLGQKNVAGNELDCLTLYDAKSGKLMDTLYLSSNVQMHATFIEKGELTLKFGKTVYSQENQLTLKTNLIAELHSVKEELSPFVKERKSTLQVTDYAYQPSVHPSLNVHINTRSSTPSFKRASTMSTSARKEALLSSGKKPSYDAPPNATPLPTLKNSFTFDSSPAWKRQRSTPKVSTVYGGKLHSGLDKAASLTVSTKESGDGIKNIGNSCYFSATLQMLFGLPGFFENFRLKADYKRSGMCRGIVDFYDSYKENHTKDKALDPTGLKAAFVSLVKAFDNKRQQDAHEFLLELFNLIDDEMASHSVLDDFFEISIGYTLECKNCLSLSEKHEHSRVLSVDFASQLGDEENIELEQLIQLYFCPEVVSHTCRECQCSEAILHKYLNSLSPILLIHIKRFMYNPEKQDFGKIQNHVSFPIVLNINRLENEVKPSSNDELQRMRLCSIISHTGAGIHSGHYVTDVYDSAAEKWKNCNDSVVKEISEKDILDKQRRKSCYILCYALDTKSTIGDFFNKM